MPDTLLIDKISEYSGHNASVYSLSSGGSNDTFYSVGGDGWIVKWPLFGNNSDGFLVGETGGKIFSSTVLPIDQLFLAGDYSGDLFWIDIQNRKILGRSAFHKGSIFDICVIDPSRIISVSGDGYICLWDTDQRRPLISRKLSSQGLRCASFDPETGSLFIGSSDNNIYILNIDDFEEKYIIRQAHRNSVFALNFIPSIGLVSGGRDAHLKIWTSTDFMVRHDVPAHWYTINKILDIPELNLIVTASRDKTMRVWDYSSFELLKTLDFHVGGHLNSVNTLLWHAQHNLLLSAGDDRVIRKWKMDRNLI